MWSFSDVFLEEAAPSLTVTLLALSLFVMKPRGRDRNTPCFWTNVCHEKYP